MKKINPWMKHLNKERKLEKNKGKSLSEIMKSAKRTYKK